MIRKIFLLNFIVAFCWAQVSTPSLPKSFDLADFSNFQKVVLPSFDVERFLNEDRSENEDGINKPYRFANPIAVNLSMNSSGTWRTLSDGSLIWKLEIESPGAYSLNLIYDQFDIPPGSEFFVYSPDKEMVIGAFTDLNHKPHGGFSTAPIKGDKVILEYNQPSNASFNGTISLSTVSHDYRGVFFNDNRGYGDSGSCNNNVACSVGDDWSEEIRSVAMILTAGGSRLCTGTLINNASQDLTPYFLTANHCLGGSDSWIFMFNYESSQCDNQNGPTNMTVSGSTLLVNNDASDVALLLLNETPPLEYNVHYAGWDVSGSTPSIPVGIHHPSGDIKKISFDYDDATNSGNYWDIDSWDDGTTEPGSSGSPLFDGITHRIIGQLYGGVASCTNFGYDTYGKTSVSWGLGLNTYLDPNGTGIEFVDGIDAIDLPDPVISLIDDSLDFELANEETDQGDFIISNVGEQESLLSYSAKINVFESPQGGSDSSGHFWSDSNSETSINSDWIDISENATVYNFQTNDTAGELINIGFSFPFYGEQKTELFINPNGWLGFEQDNDSWDNSEIPSENAPKSAIFGFWDDLNPINDDCNSCAGEVSYNTDGERLVVWFNNVGHWPTNFENSYYDFQIVLHKNGSVNFNYNNMVGISDSATIGMQNSSGSSGVEIAYNTNYATSNLTAEIQKNPSWLGINNLENYEIAGQLLDGESTAFNILLLNDDLPEGSYRAFLKINSNAGFNETFPINLLSLGDDLILGDLNGDTLVNVVDVVQLVSMALGSTTPDLRIGDLNLDGVINVLDVIQLVSIVLDTL